MSLYSKTTSKKVLIHFYKKLEQNLRNYKSNLDGGSVLLTLLKISNNKISELLNISAIEGVLFDKYDIDELIENNYIRSSDQFGKTQNYVLTTFGIWEIESKIKGINIEDFLGYYQKEKFSPNLSNATLSNKEKIILLSMIAMRNFSKKATMDLNDETKSDSWIYIFDECTEFLNSKKAIDISEWKNIGSGNEHPVNYEMRRAYHLPKKTKLIYQTCGNYRYYLDILSQPITEQKKLVFLFGLIFYELDSIIEVDGIHKFLSDLAYNKSASIFENFDFITHEWDNKIKKALEKYYYQI